MYSTNLRKVGGSVMLAVPPTLLDILNLRAGATVGITIDDGKIVVSPYAKPHYSLDELLEQCDSNAPFIDEDRAWIDLNPVGGEL